MRHLYMECTNVAHRLPRGKRSTWNENQPAKSIIEYENSFFTFV
ncbi:hypothetical protein [Fictibacillus sp. UD]